MYCRNVHLVCKVRRQEGGCEAIIGPPTGCVDLVCACRQDAPEHKSRRGTLTVTRTAYKNRTRFRVKPGVQGQSNFISNDQINRIPASGKSLRST